MINIVQINYEDKNNKINKHLEVLLKLSDQAKIVNQLQKINMHILNAQFSINNGEKIIPTYIESYYYNEKNNFSDKSCYLFYHYNNMVENNQTLKGLCENNDNKEMYMYNIYNNRHGIDLVLLLDGDEGVFYSVLIKEGYNENGIRLSQTEIKEKILKNKKEIKICFNDNEVSDNTNYINRSRNNLSKIKNKDFNKYYNLELATYNKKYDTKYLK